MRLVGEWTRQTRLQIKAWLLLCSRSSWSTCVTSKNEWSFGIQVGKKKKNNIQSIDIYLHSQVQISFPWFNVKVPGVFVAERVEVLTLLGFVAPVVCFCGVLKVTQGDMRAGVFTKDLLYLLSRVASEKLHTNTSGCYSVTSNNTHVMHFIFNILEAILKQKLQNVSYMLGVVKCIFWLLNLFLVQGKMTYRTLILRVESTDGVNGASFFPTGLFGALLPECKVCLHFVSASLLFTGTGLNIEARLWFAFCRKDAYTF